ncbi:MAG: PEP-CTERM sorting domain-containing protein [Aestuariibacter sp.]|nr:PEP-CTERM sorting domain-containing protein [Aestuariibacter sp.]
MNKSYINKLLAYICLSLLTLTNVNANPITSTVTGLGDGKEWAQVKLFTSSWDEINIVCPGGICDSTNNGLLNTFNMDGWAWASIYDVGTLFSLNSSHPGGIGGGTYMKNVLPGAPASIDIYSSFLNTSSNYVYGLTSTLDTSDPSKSQAAYMRKTSLLHRFLDTENNLIPTSSSRPYRGGWFYRSAAVPEPSTLLLLSAGLLGLSFRRRR